LFLVQGLIEAKKAGATKTIIDVIYFCFAHHSVRRNASFLRSGIFQAILYHRHTINRTILHIKVSTKKQNLKPRSSDPNDFIVNRAIFTISCIVKSIFIMTANRITNNLDNPDELEKYYRDDRKEFEKEFYQMYADFKGNKLADFWKVRLDFEQSANGRTKVSRYDIITLIVICTIAGFLIEIPTFFNIDLKTYFFYEKNAGIIVFMGLSLYAILTRQIFRTPYVLVSLLVFLIAAVYINLLPSNRGSQSINLAYIHLPLFMWCIYGWIFIDFDATDKTKRINYIKYNGDLAILGAIILIAGAVFTALTLGLFNAIGLNIERFYMNYIAIWGLVSAPIVATYIIRAYPFVTNKIAPIIANLFSPLVLITLIIYLISIPIAGKDPYNDRNFLLVFNLMLLGVMGIIVFAISEISANSKQRFGEATLLLLALVTLLIDLVALSAILYRLGEFGFTPNRTAVLISNLLITGNLILIIRNLFNVNFKKADIRKVEMIVSGYLPLYIIWTIIVAFGFPLIFGLK
jgi:hypothetical protein